MIALYKKELRALWPLGLLMFVFMAADLFYRPFTERLDERSWEDIASYLEPGDPGAFAYILMVLIAFVAFSAFPREHDERTIELLYALPLRRSSIFFAKILAGFTVLLLAEVGLTLSDAIQSSFNHQSLSGDHIRLDIALTYLGLELAFCVVVYSHALVGSVLRLLGLLPYVLLLFFVSMIDDLLPSLAWVDPSELLVARYEGRDLDVPVVPLIAHLLVAALALAAAYGLWMGPAEAIGRFLGKVRASIVGKLVMGCASVIGFAFLALIVASFVAFEPEPEPGEEAASFETADYDTERYTFSYPVSHEARALALADEADRLHREVQSRLGADPGPKLLADLTEVSSDHLGIASWTHLRVGLVGEADPIRLQRTFTHETVHAFQHRLSDRRQSDAGASTRFFAEGSAEWVALEIVPLPEGREQARWIGVAAFTRHQMTSLDLIDDTRLTARFDTMLRYSLGELWVDALVRTCGEDAIGDALRAMARSDAPMDLSPRSFWEDTLRAIGCDYESVDGAFLASAEAIEAAHEADIATLPRMGGGVVRADGASLELVARLDRDPPEGARFIVAMRASPDAPDTESIHFRGTVSEDDPRVVRFDVLRVLVPAERFQLRFTVLPPDTLWGFSETWQWASAR